MQGISPLAKELLATGGGFCSVGVARPLVPVQQIARASHNINYELKKLSIEFPFICFSNLKNFKNIK